MLLEPAPPKKNSAHREEQQQLEETPHQWPNQTFLSAPLISLKDQHKACPDEICFPERIFEEQAVSNQNARGKSLQCTVIAVPQLSEAGELLGKDDWMADTQVLECNLNHYFHEAVMAHNLWDGRNIS